MSDTEQAMRTMGLSVWAPAPFALFGYRFTSLTDPIALMATGRLIAVPAKSVVD